ncbi:hypothetical protein AB0I06_08070 [Streptomyces sp. NPDC050674]|uniref:hypothetical protein n=1 Tax=Streptomyces sp. NPDC050674 TaxID=3157216 RepID=UPI003429F659
MGIRGFPRTWRPWRPNRSRCQILGWSAFQIFGPQFEPDYTAGTLTSDYLSALKDGETATLTFHFWSGAKVTYHSHPAQAALAELTGRSRSPGRDLRKSELFE